MWIPARCRPSHGQVPGQRRPTRQHHGVEFGRQRRRRHHSHVRSTGGPRAAPLAGLGVRGGVRVRRWGVGGGAHRRGTTELDALGPQLGEAAVEHGLLHLELGDPVPQQATGSLGALVDHHPVSGPRQLLRARQPGGPGPHHGDGLAGAYRGDLGGDPALTPTPLRDLVLDALDRHRIGVDAEHTRPLARCGAQAPRELGEVVGGMEPLEGFGPVAPVHEVVPFRDEIPERASLVAERDPAVHAARALTDDLVLGERLVDLAPVPQPHRHGAARRQLSAELEETCGLAHGSPLLIARARPCGAAMTATSTDIPWSTALRVASSTRR